MANRFWVGGTANWDSTAATKWSTTSGGPGGASAPGSTDNVFFDGNSGTGAVTIAAGASLQNFDSTGFTGSFIGSNGLTPGSGCTVWTWGAGVTQGWTGAINFTSTSGTTVITSNGKQFKNTISFTGVGGTFSLADAFNCTNVVTVTNGTFNSNGFPMTVAVFSSNNSNIRTIILSNSNITLTGSGSVLQLLTTTNLTFIATGSLITITDTSITTKTVNLAGLTFGNMTFAGANGFTINSTNANVDQLTVGASTTTLDTSLLNLNGIDFTGYTGTWNARSGALTLTKDFILSAGMTISNLTDVTLQGVGNVQNLATNGVNLPGDMTIDNVGGLVQLVGSLTSTATRTLHLKHGTFDAGTNNVNIGVVDLAPSGAGTRVLNMGSGVWTLTRSGGPVSIWNAGGASGLTVNGQTADIVVANVAAAKLFTGGGFAYGTVTFAGASATSLTITDTGNTFKALAMGPGATLVLPASGTTTVGTFANVGTALLPITVESSSSGTQTTLFSPVNDNISDYLAIKDVKVTGGARWFAGRHSVDNGDNNGWRFTNQYRSPLTRSASAA